MNKTITNRSTSPRSASKPTICSRCRSSIDRSKSPSTLPSFSPSAAKPALAVASWQQLGIPLDIRNFEPLTRNQIKLAHDPAFVDALLDCGISNGFGNRSRAVATSLPYTTGSMLAAAQEALRNGIGAIRRALDFIMPAMRTPPDSVP